MLTRRPPNDLNSAPSQQSPQHQSAHEIASQIALRQNSGTDARNLIAPHEEEEDNDDKSSAIKTPSPSKSTLSNKKSKTKSHQSFHRRALREMQKKNQLQSENEKNKAEKEKRKQNARKLKQFGNVQSRVYDSAASYSSSSSSSSSIQNSRSESIIPRSLSPSSTSAVAGESGIAFGRRVPKALNSIHQRNDGFISQQQKSQGTDAAGKFRSHCYGRVPNYILKRKTAMAEAEERRRQKGDESDDDGPPAEGMVRMKEIERLETLRLLEESEEKARTELQRLPLSMQGHGSARKRDKLEVRLREIEDAKQIFSKEKVYIQQV